MTETNKKLLEVYEAALAEGNEIVRKEIQSMIMRLSKDDLAKNQIKISNANAATVVQPSAGGFTTYPLLRSHFNLPPKKKSPVATKKVMVQQTAQAQEVAQVKDIDVEDKELVLLKQLNSLTDEEMVNKYGGLQGLMNMAKETQGVKFEETETQKSIINKVRLKLVNRIQEIEFGDEVLESVEEFEKAPQTFLNKVKNAITGNND